MFIINREKANNAPVIIAKRNMFLLWDTRIKKIVITITHKAEIINICGNKEGSNRLRKKTSRAVFPIMIDEIKQKK